MISVKSRTNVKTRLNKCEQEQSSKDVRTKTFEYNEKT